MQAVHPLLCRVIPGSVLFPLLEWLKSKGLLAHPVRVPAKFSALKYLYYYYYYCKVADWTISDCREVSNFLFFFPFSFFKIKVFTQIARNRNMGQWQVG